MTTNEQLLLVSSEISSTEEEIAKLDWQVESLAVAKASIVSSVADNQRVVANADGLSAKVRAAQFSSSAALVELARADVQATEKEIERIKIRILALGEIARSDCAEILNTLFVSRKANAREALEQLLDYSKLHSAFSEGLELCARAVLELKPLEIYFGDAWIWETDRKIAALRFLREYFSTLRGLVEAEPGLALTLTERPAVMPVIESKPAQATMSAALVAV